MILKFLAVLFLLAIAAFISTLTYQINFCGGDKVLPVQLTYEINDQKTNPVAYGDFINDPNPSIDFPKVAWLMSFPNSGTSFTMKLVGQASNKTTATNYGLECEFDHSGENLPLKSYSPSGPYVSHPNMDLPEHYILTKTHCGGRCIDCGPSRYLETKDSFMEMCAKGAHVSSTNITKVHVKYDPHLAQRAIHLVRDPFDNVVSNFHLERHTKEKKGKDQWLKHYPNNPDGFKNWCRHLDGKYAKEEKSMRLIPDSLTNMFDGLPCHSIFYTFTQWHNLAVRVIEDLQLPVLVIHYEDYEEIHFKKTTRQIFDFLHTEPVDKIPPFVPGKQYKHFYTNSERQKAKLLLEKIADRKTWVLIQRYFEE